MQFPTTRFSELLAYPLRSGATVPKDHRGKGIPMVNMGELFKYPRLGRSNMTLVDIDYSDADRHLLQKGDLLFARRSLTLEGAGKCAVVVDASIPTTWESSIIRARIDQKHAHPDFYYYFFRSAQGRRAVESIVEQVAAAGIRSSDLANLRVPLPPLHVQAAIAEILGALDDKIAVNERVAETATDLAEALYARESSSIQGWFSVKLSEAARWLSGGTPKTSEPSYWGGGIPWISAASLKSPWIDDSDRKVTSEGAENGTRLVPAGSIIFVVRGMSLTSEFRVGLTQREVAFGQDCKALIPRAGINPATLFLAIKLMTPEILGYVDLAGHGTGRLATDRIANLSVKLPTDSAAADFAQSVVPLIERASATKRENRTLAALRDTLLPQLVTGKLRIKDAERAVEDAV
jgi:type I restriction enzyme S subunit